MRYAVMTMIVCLSFSTGCAAKPPTASLQEAERIHWRPDVGAYEMSKATLEASYADCRFTPAPTDDPVRDSTNAGKVLVTDGFLSRLMNVCELNKKTK